jgi:hypothetical protein
MKQTEFHFTARWQILDLNVPSVVADGSKWPLFWFQLEARIVACFRASNVSPSMLSRLQELKVTCVKPGELVQEGNLHVLAQRENK